MVGDGAAFSVMVGLGETYFPVFALALGFGAAIAGWLATLPLLAGGLFQLVTPFAVVRLRSCRRWVVLCASVQAASFVPLAVAALVERASLELLFLCSTLYWGFGMGAGPAWNTWAETLVPGPERARFFAHRARWSQGALLIAVLAGGFALEVGRTTQDRLGVFAVLFTLAAVARAISTLYLLGQSEPPDALGSQRARTPWDAWTSLRGSDAQRLLLYLLAIQVAVNVASPFFTPYMLDELALSYAEYTLLTAAAFGTRLAVLPWIGRLAHARGNRLVLWIGALGITPLPALWLASDSFTYLLVLQIVAGGAWACLELSTLLSFFEVIDPDERTSVLSTFNLLNAVAMAAGSLLGGWCLREMGATPAIYALLFVGSTAGRAASLWVLGRVTVQDVPLEASALRTLAVRPSLGAVQRPILAALPDEPESPTGDDEPNGRSA